MKLSVNHPRDSGRTDIVHSRAAELRINPEEVFARAYIEAGMLRSDSIAAFRRYCSKKGGYEIPPIVQKYCEGPIRSCDNPDCKTGKPGRFTRTDVHDWTSYFCSAECMCVKLPEVPRPKPASPVLLPSVPVRTETSRAAVVAHQPPPKPVQEPVQVPVAEPSSVQTAVCIEQQRAKLKITVREDTPKKAVRSQTAPQPGDLVAVIKKTNLAAGLLLQCYLQDMVVRSALNDHVMLIRETAQKLGVKSPV